MTYDSDQVTIIALRVRVAELEQQLQQACRDVAAAQETMHLLQIDLPKQLTGVLSDVSLQIIARMHGVVAGSLATTRAHLSAALEQPHAVAPEPLPANVTPIRRAAPRPDLIDLDAKHDSEVRCRADAPDDSH